MRPFKNVPVVMMVAPARRLAVQALVFRVSGTANRIFHDQVHDFGQAGVAVQALVFRIFATGS
jgi:hypothetical protein